MTDRRFTEPAFVATYGPSGWGKSTDCLFSFPGALFLSQPGALKPWMETVGLPYPPYVAPGIKTISQATKLIQQEAKTRKYSAIVADDWSLISEASYAEAQVAFPKGGLQFWGRVRQDLLDFRQAARDAGLHIVVNCHIRNPHTDEKKGYVLGGPMLPGTMVEDFPKAVDTCLRVIRDDTYPVWPFLYSGDERAESGFVEKDRHGLIPRTTKVAPMNLGEILRPGFGVDGPLGIRRAVGFEWMENVVEQIAAKLGDSLPGDATQKALLAQFVPLIEAKYTKNHLQIGWVFRDAQARAVLQLAKKQDVLAGYTG
jgi:AAA domain